MFEMGAGEGIEMLLRMTMHLCLHIHIHSITFRPLFNTANFGHSAIIIVPRNFYIV